MRENRKGLPKGSLSRRRANDPPTIRKALFFLAIGCGLLLLFSFDKFIASPRNRIKGEALIREHNYEGSQFVELINAARTSSTESLRGALSYPAHSLVVYSELTGDGETVWEKGLKNWVPGDIYVDTRTDDADDYHYASPKYWLATQRSGVKLVVIVSRGPQNLIGYYSGNPNRPAYSIEYDMKFFDVKSGAIVAKRAIKHFDQNIEPSLPPFFGSSTLPSESEVVKEIRSVVAFRDSPYQ